MKPEYYRFIKPTQQNFTKDKIYKIINPENLTAERNFIDDRKKRNGWSVANAKYFEPVEKEEYLIQEGMITKQEQNYDYLVEFLTRNNIK